MSELDQLWKKLSKADNQSLLKKHLTHERYDHLKRKRTKFGGTLADCIRAGCKFPSSSIGIYASDATAYTTFVEVFDPIIHEYHNISVMNHPPTEYGDVNNIGFYNLDPTKELILSCTVCVNRSLEGFGFHPVITKGDRFNMERIIVEALTTLEGDLAGSYFPMVGMSSEVRKKLIDQDIYFRKSDKLLKAAGGYDDWPAGRGIFQNWNKDIVCWVNEEDHLRIFSSEKGGRLADAYKRSVRLIQVLEKKLTFAKNNCGYVNFCCSNLGVSMKVSVLIKLPYTDVPPHLEDICKKYCLAAKVSCKVNSSCLFEISNQRCLGLTEFDVISSVAKGIMETTFIEEAAG